MGETKALILKMRPKYQELRDARMYSEPTVKRILLGFAHDIGCKWSDEQLRNLIETVFDFD